MVGAARRARPRRTPAGSTSTGRRRSARCSCRCWAGASARCVADGEITLDRTAADASRCCATSTTCSRSGPGTEDLPLDELLDRQFYRLAHWRVGDEELNYRRFFDIDTLAGVRVEDEQVFAETHAVLLALVAEGRVDGLRIDHPDGLADPRELPPPAARRHRRRLGRGREDPRGRRGAARRLAVRRHDRLRRAAPGRRRVRRPRGCRATLTNLYTGLTGEPADFAAVVEDAKRFVIEHGLQAEVAPARRGRRRRSATSTWSCATTPAAGCARRWSSCSSRSPVYRAYVVPDEPAPDGVTRRPRRPPRPSRGPGCPRTGTARSTWSWHWRSASAARGPHRDEFVVRFQQTCGPVMAKGVEDTAFYRWLRLTRAQRGRRRPGPPRRRRRTSCTRGAAASWRPGRTP